jgi:acyl-CoA thioester hydrolase
MESLNELLKTFRFRIKIEKRWSDLDEVGHVNNAVYLTYFEQARVYYFHDTCRWDWKEDGVILANTRIDYIKPVLYPDPTYIYVRTSRIGTKSIEMEYVITNEDENGKVLMSRGSSVLVMFDYKKQASFPVPDRIRNQMIQFEPSLS